jgi:endonuclease/exonuclease/phosphatase family metal-dependent hydrolase
MIFFLIAAVVLAQPIENQSITDSIIPWVEKVQDLSQLNKAKYAEAQFEEISEVLSHKEERIRLATFNILRSDLAYDYAEIHQWEHRLPRVIATIQEMDADVLGVQEMDLKQRDDLMAYLKDTYSFYGVPRKDGELAGIFYRKDRFEVKKQEAIQIPGIEKEQLLHVLELRDIKTGKSFRMHNLHNTFSRINLRQKEVAFIADLLKSHTVPVIYTADVNSFPNRPDLINLPAYDGDYVHRTFTRYDLKDAQEVSILGHVGPLSTFTNKPGNKVGFSGQGEPGVILDHIYVSPEIAVFVHACQPVRVNGHFPSDHIPVLMDFYIR